MEKFKKIIKALLPTIIKIVVAVVLLVITFTFIFGIYRIDDYNMYPALKDGDLCITYKLEDYYKDDIVVYEIDGKKHIGRIVARVGDTVDSDSTGLIVNGSYAVEEIFYETDMTDAKLPCTLGEGEVYVLNDYRSDKKDSRIYGAISKENLKGKVIFVFRRRGF